MLPLVSIITPSFNQGSFLEATILSVLEQDYKNIEYLVIDGGSNDNSVEIIKKYDEKISYWVSEKDNGQADAINKGFLKAKGDYLCWVNSDDLLYPDFISRRINEFKQHPGVEMIYGDVDQGWELQNKFKRKGKQQTYEEMLSTCIIRVPQMSAVWSRKALNIIGLLNTKLNVLLDWEYILRTTKHVQILYSPGSVAFFRQHEDSKSVKHSLKWVEEIETYYSMLFEREKFGKRFRRLTQVNMYFYCAEIFKEDLDTDNENAYWSKAKNVSSWQYFKRIIKNRIVSVLVKIKKALHHGRK